MSALKRLGIDLSQIQPFESLSKNQKQTQNTFGFKWSKRDTYESDFVKTATRQWLLEKYCNNDPERIDEWLAGERKIILDAGCGAGRAALLFFGDRLKDHDYLGVDISDAVDVARDLFRDLGYSGDFIKINLMELPIADHSIDIIFSEGVLHHTDSTEKSLKFLAGKLKAGGRFLFYVYAKKAVIREFTDDYIREAILHLNDDEAWKALEPLTKLGIALGKLNTELEISEDIPFLGIRKGKMDLQRFFYWNICKAFYRPEFSLDEMNHVNFDWFRPLNCHRHTPEEIQQWCDDSAMTIEQMDIQTAGITVVAVKN